MVAIDSDPLLTKAEKAQQKQSLYIAYNLNGTLGSHSLATTVSPLSNSFYSNDTVESVVGKYTWYRIITFMFTYITLTQMFDLHFRKCVRRVTFRRPVKFSRLNS